MDTKPLSKQHQLFCAKYVELLNERKAAIAAGYSEKSAAQQASRLLKNANIRDEIERLMSERLMGKNEILMRLGQIASADIDDIMTTYGNLPAIDFEKAARLAKTGLIKKIKVTTRGVEFELHDKMRALELLGKFYMLWVDRIQVEDEWQAQAVEDIKTGRIKFDALAEAFDMELATDLFRKAGIPTVRSE